MLPSHMLREDAKYQNIPDCERFEVLAAVFSGVARIFGAPILSDGPCYTMRYMVPFYTIFITTPGFPIKVK